VWFRLCGDDVRIWARAIRVVGAYPIVIERIRSQTRNVSTRRIADIQVLVSWDVSSKGIVCSHIEAITSRTCNTAPITGETGGRHIGRA